MQPTLQLFRRRLRCRNGVIAITGRPARLENAEGHHVPRCNGVFVDTERCTACLDGDYSMTGVLYVQLDGRLQHDTYAGCVQYVRSRQRLDKQVVGPVLEHCTLHGSGRRGAHRVLVLAHQGESGDVRDAQRLVCRPDCILFALVVVPFVVNRIHVTVNAVVMRVRVEVLCVTLYIF